MYFVIREYNVLPNEEDRDEYFIVFNDNVLKDNDKETIDQEIIDKVIEIMNSYKKEIIKSKSIKYHNQRGGRQKLLRISFDNEEYNISGCSDNKKIDLLYNSFKNDISSLLTNN